MRVRNYDVLAQGWNKGPLRLCMMCSSLALATGMYQPAFSQEVANNPVKDASAAATQPASDPGKPDQADAADIVVTASRAAPTGYDSPTPTAIFSSKTVEREGSVNIGQLLFTNPAFKSASNPASNGQKVQNPAQATADLRGLSAQRTLVLFDGMRVVPAASTNTGSQGMAPDLNSIPTLMVDRVEVVTGGASAQWGSDAVAGVVNIRIKKRYDGLMFRVIGGVSGEGDNDNVSVNGLYGTSFAGDRAHLVIGADYVHNSGLGSVYTRDWGRQEFSTFTNGGRLTNGLPAFIVAPNIHVSTSPGGLITGPANFRLNGYEFTSGTTAQPFNFGSLVSGASMIGGQGQSLSRGQTMAPSVERYSTYGRFEYELTPDIKAYVEGGYAGSRGRIITQPGRVSTAIRNDNPFLPATVLAAMAADNVSSFTFSRLNYDLGQATITVRDNVGQGGVGAEGKLGGDWTFDAHANYGRNVYRFSAANDPISQNLAFATDAVSSGGQIVCRATLPGPAFRAAAAGCVPINLFGDGSPSPQAAQYVTGEANNKAVYTLKGAALNIQGKPFSTWAGPVGIGAGVEYRSEEIRTTVDPIGQAAGFGVTGNAGAFNGSFNVKEGYFEANVPLVRDLPLLRSVDLNGAVRYADYSNFGGRTTWKVGMTDELFDGLRLRMTRSRDLRAPALYELFSPGGPVSQAVSVNGRSAVILANISKGNPNLGPETADTLTLGAVIEPKGGFSGLRLSVDRFDIKIKDAITNFANAAQGLCTSGNALACSFFTFDAAGTPQTMVTTAINAAALQYVGYDFNLNYQKPLEDIIKGALGSLEFNFSGSYMQHAYIDLGVGAGRIDRAGENSQLNVGAIPRFTGVFSATYAVGQSSITAQARYVSKGVIDKTFNTAPSNTINDNNVPSVVYLNLFGTLSIDDEGKRQFFFGIDNVFDKSPPIAPFPAVNLPTNPTYYDIVGRAFRLGATFKF